jgi:hypothetical protein
MVIVTCLVDGCPALGVGCNVAKSSQVLLLIGVLGGVIIIGVMASQIMPWYAHGLG